MKRKAVVSGPVRGELVEVEVDHGPSAATPRQGLFSGQYPGTKAPPPVEGPPKAKRR
jgi:hypothetical protein